MSNLETWNDRISVLLMLRPLAETNDGWVMYRWGSFSMGWEGRALQTYLRRTAIWADEQEIDQGAAVSLRSGGQTICLTTRAALDHLDSCIRAAQQVSAAQPLTPEDLRQLIRGESPKLQEKNREVKLEETLGELSLDKMIAGMGVPREYLGMRAEPDKAVHSSRQAVAGERIVVPQSMAEDPDFLHKLKVAHEEEGMRAPKAPPTAESIGTYQGGSLRAAEDTLHEKSVGTATLEEVRSRLEANRKSEDPDYYFARSPSSPSAEAQRQLDQAHRVAAGYHKLPLTPEPKGLAFQEALVAIRRGARARRSDWNEGHYLRVMESSNHALGSLVRHIGQWIALVWGNDNYTPWISSPEDFTSSDWEVHL